ncbi:hypothetical protein [Acidocella facilis]|uniref:hypothetical protein n=1 Tax=Acidocella facilis TaxID=525 RepID=UPI00047DCFB5|nr:hypothetical protein [Acidocella facilis]
MKRVLATPTAAETLFPDPQVGEFLDYVRDVWTELKAVRPAWWAEKKETTLVAGLFHALNDDNRRQETGIVWGHFVHEASDVELDAKGMPKYRGRTDIKFIYAANMGPELVLEFKRLDNKRPLRKKYASEGVGRFASGKYSSRTDMGIMVGMVNGCVITEKAQLCAYLSETKVVTELSSQPITHPAYGDPSKHGALAFDTKHARPAHCLANMIVVGHMLLER